MKKVFAILIVLMLVLTILAFSATKAFSMLEEQAMAIGKDVNAAHALSAGDSAPLPLTVLEEGAVVYDSLFGYFVGENRTSIDKTYPLYLNDGATLRFLNEEQWLITADMEIFQTFEGLYLNNGYTFNADRQQADDEEFILFTLPNGLHMNAQPAVFSSRFEDYSIRANSILYMTSTEFRWLSVQNESLVYGEADSVFDATLTIGGHTYPYADFLKAMNLVTEAIEAAEDRENDKMEGLLNEADELLRNSRVKNNSEGANEGNSGADNYFNEMMQSSGGENALGSMAGTVGVQIENSSQQPAGAGFEGEVDSASVDESKTEEEELDTDFEDRGEQGEEESETGSESGYAGDGGAGAPAGGMAGTSDAGDGEESDEGIGEDADVVSDLGETGAPQEGNGTDSGREGSSSDLGGGSSPSQDIPYTEPVVTLSGLDPWAYSCAGHLYSEDPSDLILRGIKIIVYKDVRRVGAESDDPEILSAEDYVGRSAVLRKTYPGTTDFILSTLPPDGSYYIQYSYKYSAQTGETDPETNLPVYERKTYYSDLYHINTLSVDDAGVKAVRGDWEETFAYSPNAIRFTGMTLENTAVYDPEAAEYYPNFKNNTIPYVNQLVFTCTPLKADGIPDTDKEIVSVSASLSVLQKAIDGADIGGTVYTSQGKLESNTKYSYTVTAYDRWKNEIPFELGEKVGDSVYTAKSKPAVAIKDVKNVTDHLTISLKISDEDAALFGDEITLQVQDRNGNVMDLAGTVHRSGLFKPDRSFRGTTDEDGEYTPLESLTLSRSDDFNSSGYLELTLDSLDFSQQYYLIVNGDYCLQPDYSDAPDKLADVIGGELGRTRVFTAAITTGVVNFNTAFGTVQRRNLNPDDDGVYDDWAIVNYTMTNKSTAAVLPLVDEITLFFGKTQESETPPSYTLKMLDLDMTRQEWTDKMGAEYDYDEEAGTILLQKPDAYTGRPLVELVGSLEQFDGCTLWESILCREITDEFDNTRRTSAATIRITPPDGSLETSTRYYLGGRSTVIKSGNNHDVPTTVSITELRTKKKSPKLEYDGDVIIAGDIVEYIDFRINDEDKTIENGEVKVYLYSRTRTGDTVREVRIGMLDWTANTDPEELRFEGLIPGAEYAIRFFAPGYNNGFDVNTYRINKELDDTALIFTAGSELSGELTLKTVDYAANIGALNGWSFTLADGNSYTSYIPGSVIQQLVEDSRKGGTITDTHKKWTEYTEKGEIQFIYSEYIPVPADATFVTLPDWFPGSTTNYSFCECRCYDGAYNLLKEGSTTGFAYGGYSYNQPVFHIPEGTKYMVLWLQKPSYLYENGVTLQYYTVEDTDLYETYSASYMAGYDISTTAGGAEMGVPVATANRYLLHKVPVLPGENYVVSSSNWITTYVKYYSAGGGYIGTATPYSNSLITVPDDVYYLSIVTSQPYGGGYNPRLYRLTSGGAGNGSYTAKVGVEVQDRKNYLDDGTPVTLEFFKSDSINALEYVSQGKEYLTLTDGVLDLTKIYSSLDPSCAWKLTLSVTYSGSLIQLDELTFRTDGIYFTISNNVELLQALRNPYGNYVVVADFEHYLDSPNETFYGTIDFQGHIITRRPDFQGELIYSIGRGGQVKNLVYELSAEQSILYPTQYLFYSNYGTIDNFIYRTNGTVTTNTYTFATRNSASKSKDTGSVYYLMYGNYGTLRNFIIRFGGDLIYDHNTEFASNSKYFGGIYWNSGLIENGYIYAEDGCGYIARYAANNAGECYDSMFVMRNPPETQGIRHMYVRMDSWYSGAAYKSSPFYDYSAVYVAYNDAGSRLNSTYLVGDYYMLNAYGEKSWSTNCSGERYVGYLSTAQLSDNWHLTGHAYTARTGINSAEVSRVRDSDWQKSVLGSAFDVENSLALGFYPRLNMNACMMRYQEYLTLPTLDKTNIPQLVADYMPEDSATIIQADESGFFTLRFRNPTGAYIQSVKIDGITCELDPNNPQGQNDDGFYDVTFRTTGVTKFLSAYKISEFRYTVGAVTSTASVSYTSKNIEFWKQITDVFGWADINKNMSWNYRIAADLDFSGNKITLGAMRINGSTNLNTSTSFTGKIDGLERGKTVPHKLKNINLSGMTSPYLIYRVDGGQVRNLIVENMTLTGTDRGQAEYAGFISILVNRAVADNIHIRNSSMKLGRKAGLLTGIAQYATVRNCSAADSVLADTHCTDETWCGGLVGYLYNTPLQSCYVRDISINAENSSGTTNVGGLAGRVYQGDMVNCYATGTLSTKAMYAGGLYGYLSTGNSSGYQHDNWSSMSVSGGMYAGGVAGFIGSTYRNVVWGTVQSVMPQYAHRIAGQYYSNPSRSNYAYARQTAGLILADDVDDARDLLTAGNLWSPAYWQDAIEIGSGFDVSVTAQGYAPKTLNADGSGTPVWGQTDIPLPGGGGEQALQMESAEYYVGKLYATAELLHENYSTADIQRMYAQGTLTIELEGLHINEKLLYDEPQATLAIAPGTTADTSIISLETVFDDDNDFALDAYPLHVRYKDSLGTPVELLTMVQYMAGDEPLILYHDIPNIGRWNFFMQSEEHRFASQNYRITGMVDFNNGMPSYINIKVGRLDGIGSAGFTNMNYTAAAAGDPWIETVSVGLDGLLFSNIHSSFTATSEQRGATGVILTAQDVKNCEFTEIFTYVNNYSASSCGFFSRIYGNIENCRIYGSNPDPDMENPDNPTGPMIPGAHPNGVGLLLEQTDNVTTLRQYGGGFASRLGVCMSDVEASEIYVSLPYTYYVGGIYGYWDNIGSKNIRGSYIRIENAVIDAYGYCGSVAGYLGRNYDMVGRNISVTASGTKTGNNDLYCGGLAGRMGNMTSTAGISNKYEIYDATVISYRPSSTNGYTGGLFGVIGTGNGYCVRDLVVENTSVQGNSFTGAAGGYLYYHSAYNVKISGCTVGSTTTVANADTMRYGGAFGTTGGGTSYTVAGVSVLDTEVMAPCNTGGVCGGFGYTLKQAYVGEDVTVTAVSEDNAGGVLGFLNTGYMTDVVCGATVTGRNNVGGLIGRTNWSSQRYPYALTRCIFNGSVTARVDYASLGVGKLESSNESYLATDLVNVLLAGDVSGPGSHTSLWANTNRNNIAPGDGSVYVACNAVSNGQTAEDIHAAEVLMGTEDKAVAYPKSGGIIEPEEFRKQSTYTGYGFTAEVYDFDAIGSENLPYVKYSSAVLPGINEADTGLVPLPDLQAERQPVYVYTSGVNSVNIEVPLVEIGEGVFVPRYGVTVNGISYGAADFCENGVLTLQYNFAVDLSVSVEGGTAETYSTADLKRSVMTYGSYWYYLQSGIVHYGDTSEIGTIGIPESVIHLWQGKALTVDGKVYIINGSTYGEEADEAVSALYNLSALDTARSVFDTTVSVSGANINKKVYYAFTEYGGERLDTRVFVYNEAPYTMDAAQPWLYDAVILTRRGSVEGYNYYRAALNTQTDSITDLLTKFYFPEEFQNNGVKELSNTVNYEPTVLACRRGNNEIWVFNFVTGEVYAHTGAESMMSTRPSLLSYARSMLRSLVAPASAEPEPEEIPAAGEPAESPADNPAMREGEMLYVPGSGLYRAGEMIYADGELTYVTGEGIFRDNELLCCESLWQDDGTAAGNGKANEENEVAAATEGIPAPESDETESIPADYTGGMIASGTGEGDGSVSSTGSAAGNPNGTDNAGTASGNGTGGMSVASASQGAFAQGASSGDASGGIVMVPPEVHTQQILASLGNLTATDAATGEMATVSARSLLSGKGERQLRASERKYREEPKTEPEALASESSFVAGTGFGRRLTDENREGFTLIGIAVVTGMSLLILVYFAFIRKTVRREK